MKNIEHVGMDSLEALSNTGLSASKQRTLKTEIICAMISIACLIIGLIYQFVVNGQTGKANGEAPLSPWKVTFLVLAIIAVVGGLWWLLTN